ncbi:MAG: hypothetical protein GX447_05045 [Elusimicrobia bacterium]|nr:hypothetical protein [Elusimicrobiota bacterium]
MNIVLMCCAILITVVFVFLSLEAIDTLKQIKKTAAEAEKLAINANERLTDIEPAFKTVNTVTNGVISGWGKLITLITSFFGK